MALLGVALAFAALLPWVALGRLAWLRWRLARLNSRIAGSEGRLRSVAAEARQLEESVHAAART